MIDRYTRPAMGRIWTEENKYRCWLRVESAASTVDAIIEETAVTRITERGATRADDRISEAGMEDRKREGYF